LQRLVKSGGEGFELSVINIFFLLIKTVGVERIWALLPA
jgi:hypothetical protein